MGGKVSAKKKQKRRGKIYKEEPIQQLYNNENKNLKLWTRQYNEEERGKNQWI